MKNCNMSDTDRGIGTTQMPEPGDDYRELGGCELCRKTVVLPKASLSEVERGEAKESIGAFGKMEMAEENSVDSEENELRSASLGLRWYA